MKKKLTVTIGIPAYNEEKNIQHLLRCLLLQTRKYYTLSSIVVISDGSTDSTSSQANSVKSKLITVTEYKNRLGQQVAQNILLRSNKSDIVILLEADTLPLGKSVIDQLVLPFLQNNSLSQPLGMVIGISVPMKPRYFFEKILAQSSHIKSRIIFTWNSGKNIYVHSGHTMKALSKNAANTLIFPNDVPEDAYTYMSLKKMGYDFVVNKRARVGMRHVSTLSERIRQVRKFKTGKIALEKYFKKSELMKEYAIPKSLLLKIIFTELQTAPVLTAIYLLELGLNRIFTMRDTVFNALYIPNTTSKQLVYEKN